MKLFILPIALAMFLIQSASYAMHHAGEEASTGGLYVSVDAGAAFVAGGSDPFFGRAGVGYSQGMFSVEAAYFESANAWSGSIWAYSRGGDFSLILRPFTHSVLKHLYVRAGGHYSRVSAGGTGYVTTNWKGVGWLAGTGFDVPINDHVSIHAGYSHYGAVGGESDNNTDALMGGFRLKF